MATVVRSDIAVQIGSTPADLQSSRVGLDTPHPYVQWSIPTDIHQARFSVKITNQEGTGAYATSGECPSSENSYTFPSGVDLGSGFEGLCTVEVAISANSTMGDPFEFISLPLHFVYDRSLEKLFNASALTLTWQAPTDPDSLPVGMGRFFHVQVATDPLFTNLVYNNLYLPDLRTPLVSFDIPTSALTLLLDCNYFYRIRDFDGMDYGAWSTPNAFHNYSRLPPQVSIVSVDPLGTPQGDVAITILLTDTSNDNCSVELSYSGAGSIGGPSAIVATTPTLCMPPGNHTIIWRTMAQMANKSYTDVVLYAIARDNTNYGPQVTHGPFTVDNSYIPDSGGGIGLDNYTFPLGGSVAIHTYENFTPEVEPVQGHIRTDKDFMYVDLPVTSRPLVWRQAYAIAPLEKRSVGLLFDGTTQAGWGTETGLSWPAPLLRNTTLNFLSKNINAHRVAPTTSATTFMFRSPVDYAAHADGWPVAFGSKILASANCFLRGYMDGDYVVEYPDFYDWTTRPAWHAGCEVWGTGDAWVQIAKTQVSDYLPCTTCGGSHWVVSPSGTGAVAPFSRIVCPNVHCQNGFDLTTPSYYSGTTNPKSQSYVDPVWVRMSHWANGGLMDGRGLFGLTASSGMFGTAVQHICGRGVSPLEANYTTSTDSDGHIIKTLNSYTLELPEGNRKLPSATVITHPLLPNDNRTTLTRQPNDFADLGGQVIAPPPGPLTITPEVFGLGGMVALPVSWAPEVTPVAGEIGPNPQVFVSGYAPTDDARYWWRGTPSQEGGFRIKGTIGRVWQTVDLSFMFLQAYWDAYNTVHWKATGSETSTIHAQFCQVLDDGSTTAWQDIQADNAVYNPTTKHWLLPPLVFDAFWDTADRSQFVTGGTYEMRLRQYDLLRNVYGAWAYSRTFQIIDGVTNPASILSSTFEPWTKVVTLTFRVDSTAQDNYSLVGFYYSLDQGATWKQIGLGDIWGQTSGLSSQPGANIHTIQWDTMAYGVPATQEVRFRIDCLPSAALNGIMLPFFKWLTPCNPVIDQADADYTTILGRPESRVWNTATGQWVNHSPPVLVPGTLGQLQNQYLQVLADGAYAFMTTDHVAGTIVGKVWDTVHGYNLWRIIDATGYAAWQKLPYGSTQTHGSSMASISDQVDYILNQQLPQLRQTLTAGEIRIRKGLMDQGYFAEEFFPVVAGAITETITVAANGQYGSAVNDVTRWWRFRVIAIADGPNTNNAIYDTSGNYAPVDTCDLETVRYIWQMDFTPTFDSQVHGTPLRSRTTDYDGTPLGVATQAPTAQATPSTSAFTAANASAPGQTAPAAAPVHPITVGGTLKLPPGDLPGKRAGDVLASGQTTFEGNYNWRVAAYNPVVAAVTARPRPLITQIAFNLPNSTLNVNYIAQAASQIDTITHEFITTGYGARHPSGFQVSHSFLETPIWVDDAPITWISNRRAPLSDPGRQINSLNWVWPGDIRSRIALLWDDDKQLYVGFTAQPNPQSGVTTNTWAIVGLRGNERDSLCQYDTYFRDTNFYEVREPAFAKVGGVYHLWVIARQNAGDPQAIFHSTSADADTWAPLVATNLPAASGCAVTWDAVHSIFVMHFCVPLTGTPSSRIDSATSADGQTFGTITTAVVSSSQGVSQPENILLNGQWVVYYIDLSDQGLKSVVGTTPTTLGSMQVELAASTEIISGVTYTVRPVMPTVMVDRYMGNPELFLCYGRSRYNGSTLVDALTHGARLEDRAWVTWVSGMENKIYAAPANLLDVPCSRDGVSCQFSIDQYTFGISEGDSVKIRLNFTNWTPETYEFHRQSDWVDVTNTAGSVLDPQPYSYSNLLSVYPYMKMS